MRRGRRDRRVGCRHQCDHGRDRQQRARDAGNTRSGVARHPRRGKVRGRLAMYETTYHRPSSVDEAAALFAKGKEAKYLAGGHTLIPVMKQRLAAPSDVIDLARIKELVGVAEAGDTLTINAATPHYDVATSATVQKAIPALAR